MASTLSFIKKTEQEKRGNAELSIETTFTALLEMIGTGEVAYFSRTDPETERFRGIDLLIVRMDGRKIPFQIKSSVLDARRNIKKFPRVPVLIVKPFDGPETVKRKVRGVLV